MRDAILARLHRIEQDHTVRIAYACESGSRAWGFPSADSDYDVRFVYVHRQDWYLSIDLERRRDVIEYPIDEQLDINGWDLRKALRLLRKGNPPLSEWLGSPIVYLDVFGVADQMRHLLSTYYSPAASMYHYLHMARGNFRDYLKGPTVRAKKYLYVLRPLLAIRYLEKGLGIVPTAFAALVEQVVDSSILRDEIRDLVAAKRDGKELDQGPRIEPISAFIEGELARLDGVRFGAEAPRSGGPIAEYNQVFRASLRNAWS
jgi:predicted nucleotidyltransferase